MCQCPGAKLSENCESEDKKQKNVTTVRHIFLFFMMYLNKKCSVSESDPVEEVEKKSGELRGVADI